MTLDEIIAYYVNLLIIQYNQKPKAQATVEAYVTEWMMNNVALDVQNGFDIETAVGVQLDTIGKYVGVDRLYTEYDDTGVWFGFSDYAGSEPTDVTGYALYSDWATKEGQFIEYDDVKVARNKLSDDDFRILIKLKIAINNINHSNEGIDDALYSVFSDAVFALDNYDMSMLAIAESDQVDLLKVILGKDLFPRPMAVLLQGILPFEDTFFALGNYDGDEDDKTTGFATYSDWSTKDGIFLSEDDFITV